MALKLVDIDDRLIHGQLASTWIPDNGIESVIIVDDKVANDPVQKSVAGLAVPKVKVSVFGVDKFIDVLKKTTLKKVTMVLFTNPVDALKMHENGLPFDYLNVSGMRYNDQRTRLHKNMSVTPEEREAFEKLIAMDDWCCSVGSANFDIRSFTLNFETNVMIYSEEVTRQAVDQFLADLDRSTEYSCEEYDRRTTMMKIRMAISRHMILLA